MVPLNGRMEAAQEAPSPTGHLLDVLIRLADGYRNAGSLWQAEELYLRLLADHAETDQANAARHRLLEMCDQYERSGQLHHARALCERML